MSHLYIWRKSFLSRENDQYNGPEAEGRLPSARRSWSLVASVAWKEWTRDRRKSSHWRNGKKSRWWRDFLTIEGLQRLF